MTQITISNERKAPAQIEQILKAMPIQKAVEFHEWMARGVIGAAKIPADLMAAFMKAKNGLEKAV